MDAALNRAAKRNGLSREWMGQVPPGKQKRSLVDDITILVVNL